MNGLSRASGRRLARVGVAVTALVCLGPLTVPPAGASPLDPGLFGPNRVGATLDGQLCSAPAAVPSRPGWSRVVCGVGANEFVVPLGVHVLEVDVRGGGGGAGGGGAPGGGGADIQASLMVAPGQLLEMAVGSAGNSLGAGGFNGGGDGLGPTPSLQSSGGGGGSTDIRLGRLAPDPAGTGPWDRILSAAGGGGAGGATAPRHGGRGGASGAPGLAGAGAPAAGAGGSAAGAGGNGAGGGSGPSAGESGGGPMLVGGHGGAGQVTTASRGGNGGGGGGGYGFGGGGAGGTVVQGAGGGGGGGGGGSDFVNPQVLRPGVPVIHTDGVNHGDGRIVITYHAPPIFCGATIYASMTLHGNLDCRGQPGLVIGGLLSPSIDQNLVRVVFNLGGHTIMGDRTQTGIFVGRPMVTIENGTVTGFGTAVAANPLVGFHGRVAPDTTIANMTLTGGTNGVAVFEGVDIDHSHVSKMTQTAVVVTGDGSAVATAVVTNSSITDSLDGIVINDVPVTINSNVISRNIGFGINAQVESVSLITSNTVQHNRAAGIVWAAGGGPGSRLAGNVANFNGTAGNHQASNDGIQVVSPAVTVAGNQADGNMGYGIQAVGAIDGGGNVASGNKGPAQCVGVVCSPG